MRKLLFIGAAALALGVAAPASAQFYAGAGPGGVGVEVGPFGAGVGPGYWGPRQRWHRAYGAYDYDYAGNCHLERERVVTPRGHMIIRTHRVCY